MKILFILSLAFISVTPAAFNNAQGFSLENESSDNNNVAKFGDPDDKDPHFDGGADKQSDSQPAQDNNPSAVGLQVGGSMDNQIGFNPAFGGNSRSK